MNGMSWIKATFFVLLQMSERTDTLALDVHLTVGMAWWDAEGVSSRSAAGRRGSCLPSQHHVNHARALYWYVEHVDELDGIMVHGNIRGLHDDSVTVILRPLLHVCVSVIFLFSPTGGRSLTQSSTLSPLSRVPDPHPLWSPQQLCVIAGCWV